MKKMKKIFCYILTSVLIVSLLPFGSMIAKAEEPEEKGATLGVGNYKVGDIIKFGKYEQDGNMANGKEDIEWQVLKVEADKVLVVSKYALEFRLYHNKDVQVTWESCELRNWLNNSFMNTAFTPEQQKKIPSVTLENKDNRYFNNAPGGNSTIDHIFCLSVEEAETYFGPYNSYYDYYLWGNKQALICSPTQYAINQGGGYSTFTEEMLDYECCPASCPEEDRKTYREIGYSTDLVGRNMVSWWLRSGTRKDGLHYAANCVYGIGTVGDCMMHEYIANYQNKIYTAVRPAMYIKNELFPNGIGLSYDSLTIQKGESRIITPTVNPSNADDKSVVWSSSNTAVATVDKNGNVKGVSAGNANITATTINGISKTIPVKVIVNPSSITLNKSTADLVFGQNLTLTPTLSPSDVTEKTITWVSSNTKVATVNNGKVKATGAGEAKITAKTSNGLTASCIVSVMADHNPDNIFADVKYDSWMYNPAKAVYDKGYMTGTGSFGGKVLFSPNTDMNRTMFVQALYSMDGKPEVTYEQKFNDVKESAWYAKAVTWAANNGVVSGNPDGSFGINGKATREQMALMLYKYAVYKKYDVSVKETTTLDSFTDANKVDSWALTAVKWAVERGIISGKGNASAGYRIDPTGKATRVECAAMMNKFSEIYANPPKMGDEDLEEPLALPEEEIEDLPLPADETEDVIIDEDVDDENDPSKNEADMNEEEINPEEDSEVD